MEEAISNTKLELNQSTKQLKDKKQEIEKNYT